MIPRRALYLACVFPLCPLVSFSQQISPSAASLTIDGNLGDAFWHTIPSQALTPSETGVPAGMGGEIHVGVRGAYLCLAARLPEPGGKVLARSAGRNPVWVTDDPNSPPVEDRMEYRLHYRTSGGAEHNLELAINPWGAYRLEQDGSVVDGVTLPAAALVDTAGWTVEAALPLSLFDLAGTGSMKAIGLRAQRVRSRRPLAPEFHWVWPKGESDARMELPPLAPSSSDLAAPAFRPPLLGNSDLPIEIGRVLQVPPFADYLDPSHPDWDDPAWQAVPAFELPRNEPYPRAPRYPTAVKWMHDGDTLALLVHVIEPEPLVAQNGGRDGAIDSDDHVAIYLATSGSSFLEILVNSVGAIRDSIGRGPHIIRLQSSWNANIKTRSHIGNGAWTARIDLPLLECAEALGETRIPSHWRVLVTRYRAPRSGEPAEVSALPPVGSESFYGPLRYRRMVLSDRTLSEAARVQVPYEQLPRAGLAAKLAALDSHVWPPLLRRYQGVRTMMRAQQQKRAEHAVLEERRAWESIKTREDWERFREVRLQRLRETVGKYPAERSPLDVRVTATHEGKGYRLENLVYQSRTGFYVSANLYLPSKPSPPMPAIVIEHSFHYPKTQGEMQDMGKLWARVGCAVLIPERLGFGERVETTPWYRQAYASRATFEKQLAPVGETFIGWMAWDLIRAVDLLYERPDIDRNRIIFIGAVAGGDEPAAVAAALDPRIDAIIPYNYDHGRVRLDADFPGELTKQINMSFVTASVAPRRYVRAFEFGWEGAAQPDFPNLWVSAWDRSKKIWGFYNALDNLATVQGYGLIRLSMERVSHAFSVGPQHRKELYPILQRWFNIPLPWPEDLAILPDSGLSVNPYREEARRQEAERRLPNADLLSIPPSVSSQLPRKKLHEIAYDMAVDELRTARAGRASMNASQACRSLQQELKSKLGDIEPAASPHADTLWEKSLPGARVEGITLDIEEGITVPLLLIQPASSHPAPAVVAISKGGKDRFLTGRSKEIENLIQAGVAVCLPDVRGTGETSPDPEWYNTGQGLDEMETALGNTVLGARLKDLRTVLAYLRTRPEIDRRRIALWGDSFAPPNPSTLVVDELEYESAPQIQYHSEPMGANLALLAALYEDDVAAVAAQRGLAGYLSILQDAFTYTPMDAKVPGILKAGDVADIAGAIAPRPLLLEGLVSGRNVQLNSSELEQTLQIARQAYQRSGAAGHLTLNAGPRGTAVWLAAQLK